MKTQEEVVAILQQPITTFKFGRYLQAAILSIAAPNNTELSALRILNVLEPTEYRALFLEEYAPITMSDSEKVASASVSYIGEQLALGSKNVQRALRELKTIVPVETVNLLLNNNVTYSPIHLVTIATFTILAMTLHEEGVL